MLALGLLASTECSFGQVLDCYWDNCYGADGLDRIGVMTDTRVALDMHIVLSNARVDASSGEVADLVYLNPFVGAVGVPCPCELDLPVPMFDGGEQSGTDLINYPIYVQHSVADQSGFGSASATAQAEPLHTWVLSNQKWFNGNVLLTVDHWEYPYDCDLIQLPAVTLATAAGAATVVTDVVPIDPEDGWSATTTVEVDFRSTMMCDIQDHGGGRQACWIPCVNAHEEFCQIVLAAEEACDNGAPFGAIQAVHFVQFDQSHTSGPGPVTTTSIQGVVAWDGSGNVIRLGFFADAAFDPDQDGNIDVVDFPVSLPSVQNPGNISVTAHDDGFQKHDGDMTADQLVCWSDRIDFIARLGAAIGDLGYTPRGDFDLDGDIDSSDYQVFVATFNATACTPDYNCDGMVNTQDQIAFLNAYAGGTLAADFNGDELVNTQDYIAFLNAWAAGC